MKKRTIFGVMTLGASIGLMASFIQIIEKLTLLGKAGEPLACDLSSVFSCSTVLTAWQSSVFGFPNALLCIVFFTFFASMGLVGLNGGTLPRTLRLWAQGAALFMLGFGLWFLTQSIYVINALCILCLFCFAGLLMINWAWLRLNVDELPIRNSLRTLVKKYIDQDFDIIAWCVLAIALVLAMILRFA